MIFPRDMTTAREWEKADLRLQFRQEISQQAGGTAIGKDMGSPLWKADFETMPLEKHEAEAIHADFLTLGGVSKSFYAHAAKRPHPHAMAGEALSGITISEIWPDRLWIRLAGMTPGLRFTAGDLVSITTAAGGRELVTCANAPTVASSGISGWLYLAPYLRAGVAVGDAVELNPPMVELRLEKDGLEEPKRKSGNLYTVAFKASQVVK